MGKPSGTKHGAQKRQIIAFSKSKMPDVSLIPEHGSPSFKETKRRAILSGLRVMKAPAVAGMERGAQGDVQVHKIYSIHTYQRVYVYIYIYITIRFRYYKYKCMFIYITDHTIYSYNL